MRFAPEAGRGRVSGSKAIQFVTEQRHHTRSVELRRINHLFLVTCRLQDALVKDFLPINTRPASSIPLQSRHIVNQKTNAFRRRGRYMIRAEGLESGAISLAAQGPWAVDGRCNGIQSTNLAVPAIKSRSQLDYTAAHHPLEDMTPPPPDLPSIMLIDRGLCGCRISS